MGDGAKRFLEFREDGRWKIGLGLWAALLDSFATLGHGETCATKRLSVCLICCLIPLCEREWIPLILSVG